MSEELIYSAWMSLVYQWASSEMIHCITELHEATALNVCLGFFYAITWIVLVVIAIYYTLRSIAVGLKIIGWAECSRS